MSERGCGSTSSACGGRWTSSSATPSASSGGAPPAPRAGFSPRVDVYYGGQPPQAVVKAELAGVDIDTVALEVAGRELVITGERPVRRDRGARLPAARDRGGPLPARGRAGRRRGRRARPGQLRGRDPAGRAAARRPGDPPRADRAQSASRLMDGRRHPGRRGRGRRRARSASAAPAPLPAALPVLPLKDIGRLPGHADAARRRPGPLDAAGRRRALRRAHAGHGRLAGPRARRARARRPLRRRGGRGRRPDAQGPRRDDADPRPGDGAGADRRLRHREAVPRGAHRGDARRSSSPLASSRR